MFPITIQSYTQVPIGEHRGCYNAPSTSEVTVVISGQQFNKRDIVLRSRDDNLKKYPKFTGLMTA